MRVSLLTACCLSLCMLTHARAADPEFSQSQLETFEKQVRPLLQKHCFKCHGTDDKIKGGLSLASRKSILSGGDQGPAVDLENPAKSLLLDAINYREGMKMPPGGKLPQADIDTLTRWVEQKLPFPAGADTPAPVEHKKPLVDDAARNYWAYRALSQAAPPPVENTDWVKNPIDAFILAKLEAAKLKPTQPADPVALIRRVTYDLTGLPPTPAEVDAFVKDHSPAAYEQLLDRLLASPQYGEKWGRHWLDLVRYAETHGYERDSAKPFAWRYRDYVIDSFNRDKPYTEFLKEQLAGDLYEPVTPESLIATGFYRLGIWDDEPADRDLARYDVLDGVVSTTTQVVLGMTVGCARCHDHKKDPILQKDYYKMLAFFQDVTNMNRENLRRISSADDVANHQKQLIAKQTREAELYAELYRREQEFRVALAAKNGTDTTPAARDLVDLGYKFYRGTWETLPPFGDLKPETAGPLASGFLTLEPLSRQEAVGLVFEGQLQVPEAGKYTFKLQSSGSVRLVIDGQTACEHLETRAASSSRAMTLKPGLASFRLEWAHTTGKPVLSVNWSGPGVSQRELTREGERSERILVADSRMQPQSWRHTKVAPATNWAQPEFDDSTWREAQGGFGVAGTPGAIVRTGWNSKAIWLRKSFELTTLPAALALDLHHDEDVEIYLNGKLVFSAPGYTVKYERVALPGEAAAALHVGKNVIAVHCRQTGGGQYIDVGLVDGQEPIERLIRTRGPEVIGRTETDTYLQLAERLAASRKETLPEPGLEVMAVTESGHLPTHVLLRGNPALVGDEVQAGIPEVLMQVSLDSKAPQIDVAKKRLWLADWIASPKNPVPARVLANRVWHYHFGRGIVSSPSDFGQLGEQPTHPELLDWLGAEIQRGGWTLKRIHKLIMQSNTYQLSSRATPEGLRQDPANNLFWRFNPHRLGAEEVRDTILSVSGRLNLKAGGPPIFPKISADVLAGQSVPGQGWSQSPPEEAARRSVYVHIKRSLLVPILSLHDQADTDSSCAVRYTTTVATQALGMLNGEFTNEEATAFAERLRRDAPNSLADQVRLAIRLTTGRTPETKELDQDLDFIRSLMKSEGVDEAAALRLYCLLAINTNELVYID